MIRRLSLQILSVLLATAFVTAVAIGCGGGDDDAGDGASGPSGGPIELLEKAAAKPLESALIDLRMAAEIPGFQILGEKISVTATGPIEWSGSGLPKADLDVMLRGGQDSFPARLTAVDDRAFVDFQGLVYEADPELVDLLPLGNGARGPTSLKQLGIDPSKWLKSAEVADGEEIGGDPTTLVTGKVDKRAVLADLTEALESSEGGDEDGQASGVKGLPKLDGETLDDVAGQIGDVHVEVNVDEKGYARRVLGELDFTMPKSVENAAFEGGTIGVELVIGKIGAKVRVQPPANPRELSDLLDFAGLIFGVEKLSDLWTKLD